MNPNSRPLSILLSCCSLGLFLAFALVTGGCSTPPTGEIKFSDVAKESQVDFHHFRADVFFNIGGGTAAADFNNDGWIDIYAANSRGNNALYRNNGDGSFTNVAIEAGVADPDGHSNAAGWGDYDNDGNIDLFLTNFGTSKLFQNNGDGTFSDVTENAGVEDPNIQFRSTGVAWGDYDQDSYLDLLIVRWITEDDPMVMVERDFEPLVRAMVLYRNNGDGTFTNKRFLLGDPRDYPSKVKGAGFKPSFLDYDGDGDLDIYTVNDFGEDNYHNVLWRNDGPDGSGEWIFTDVSAASGADVAISGMSLAVGDYDNDRDLDLYMTNMGPSRLLANQGDGTFVNVADETGAGRGQLPGDTLPNGSVGWGSAFGDFDNDGDLDLYYVAGGLEEAQPNALMVNDGTGSFEDLSALSGTDDMGVGRGLVCADFDNDGKLDLFVVNMGDEQGNPGIARLFRNESDVNNHWLAVKLVGTASNRHGNGARITVTAGNQTQVREAGASQSQMSHSNLPAHFGLGVNDQVDRIEIRWPGGETQDLESVKANQVLTINEPSR